MIDRINDMVISAILDTDSYKFSHYCGYPPGTSSMFSYLESRGGKFEYSTLFGLQYIAHKYLAKQITAQDVSEAANFAEDHGVPFNREGWEVIVQDYNGFLPVTIRAIPEGMLVPTGNVLLTVGSVDDPRVFWVTNWIETLLSRIWYPSTVAMQSREIRQMWAKYLEKSSDNPAAELDFKHHDFGSRGVTSQEQAMLGGAAHLLSFSGTDTVAGVRLAQHYYGADMPGFSIPATEHSVMTAWGAKGEAGAIDNWIEQTLVKQGPGSISACVGDTYNIFNFVREVCSHKNATRIKESGGTLVIRPDSGNPLVLIPNLLHLIRDLLPEREVVTNAKGYDVLPSYLRIIWGDGIDIESAENILKKVTSEGWSASNIAFGSGGGLLQNVNRDTQRFAFKCSSVRVNGEDVAVRKDPITDSGKRSKAGRLDLIRDYEGNIRTVVIGDEPAHARTLLRTAYCNGEIHTQTTFDACKKRLRGGE